MYSSLFRANNDNDKVFIFIEDYFVFLYTYIVSTFVYLFGDFKVHNSIMHNVNNNLKPSNYFYSSIRRCFLLLGQKKMNSHESIVKTKENDASLNNLKSYDELVGVV